MDDQVRLQPIGEVRPRELVTVQGIIRKSTAMALRGCPACRYALTDGTGELDLIFLGRVEVGGLEAGRECQAEGRAAVRDDRIVLWNPRYRLMPRDGDDAEARWVVTEEAADVLAADRLSSAR
jgi:hypothetical protein